MSSDKYFGRYIWNADKEADNILLHGLDFSKASEAFLDPNRRIATDERHSKNEERLFCIGMVEGRIATVRFTLRGSKIRIIGAGFWRKGRKLYEEKIKK